MIEFQYFDGCPNSTETLDNLRNLINDGFINEKELKIIKIPDLESAEKLNFQGSPTILINGYDIYTEKKPASFTYSCRVYNVAGEQTGILTKQFILAQLNKLRT